MTILKRYHAYCDRCGCKHFLDSVKSEPLLSALLTSGWKTQGEQNFCPLCHKKLDELETDSKDAGEELRDSKIQKPNHPILEKEYLNEKEVSQIAGVSLSTLRSHRSQQKGMAYIKIGRSVRYKNSDVMKYLDGMRIEPRY